MPILETGEFALSYDVYGDGPPVLCIHGFGSSARVNWVETGWIDVLVGAGYRAIAFDNRGHGESAKPYDPAAYDPALMAGDAVALLDALGVGKAAVLGYSMGARIAAFLALEHPDRVACAIWGGMGTSLFEGLADSAEIIAGLTAPTLAELTHPAARQFRIFAEHTGSDRRALAACMETSRRPMSPEDARRIEVPVLVAVGEDDVMAGRPDSLAAHLPRGEAFVIPRRDHMRATGDPRFKAEALAFLGRTFPISGGS